MRPFVSLSALVMISARFCVNSDGVSASSIRRFEGISSNSLAAYFSKIQSRAENPLPYRLRLFDQKVVLTHHREDVLHGFRLVSLEFGKSHGLALRTDATSVEAKRRASRSTAGVSSGTKSLEFCASSKTSRNVHRSFWNRTLPVDVFGQAHAHIHKNAVGGTSSLLVEDNGHGDET